VSSNVCASFRKLFWEPNALPKSTPGALTGMPPSFLIVPVRAVTCSFSLSRIVVARLSASPDRPLTCFTACV